ncbi:MAG: ABC transporter permease [Limnochordia bacterium]|jgi:ABC-2 type transport system permease protein
MKAAFAIYKANWREYVRTPAVLAFTVIMPLVLAIFLSLIMGDQPGFTSEYYLPNMLGVSLMWLGVFATAQPLVEQREQKLFRRMAVTPLSRRSMLAGQVAFRVSIGLGQAALFLLAGRLGFGLFIQGHPGLLIAATVMGALVFVTLGYVLAGLTPNLEAAPLVAQPVQMGMMFLSGTLLPSAMLPVGVRPVVHVVPLTYVADALRQTVSALPPLYPLWIDFAAMAGWIVLFSLLSLALFRWE